MLGDPQSVQASSPFFFIHAIHYLRLHAKEKAQILAKEKGLRLAEKEVKQIVEERADKQSYLS